MTDTKRKPGRPKIITLEIVERVAERVGRGLTVVQSCSLEEPEVNPKGYENAIHTNPEFKRVHARAMNQFLNSATQQIAAGCKTWSGLAWLLERRHRAQFGKAAEVEVTQTQSVGLTFTPDTLADLERLARQQFDRPPAGKNQIEP